MTNFMERSNDSPRDLDLRVRVDDLARGELMVRLRANEAQNTDLADRFGLIAVHQLTAQLKIDRFGGGKRYRVAGEVSGEVEQMCAISLKPVRQNLTIKFEEFFAKKHDIKEVDIEIDVEHEDPEPIVDGTIEVGELVAQVFSLSIDPYFRASEGDEEIEGLLTSEEELERQVQAEKVSPFGVLAQIRGPDAKTGSN